MSEMILITKADGTLERLKVGDANSPVCYRLVCSCKAVLGVLASFTDHGFGFRAARCGLCDLCTFVQGASVVWVGPSREAGEIMRGMIARYKPADEIVGGEKES